MVTDRSLFLHAAFQQDPSLAPRLVMKCQYPLYGLLLTLVFVLTAQGQTPPEPSRFFAWAYQDAADLVGDTDGQTVLYTAGFIGVLLPLSPFDEGINPQVQSVNRGALHSFLRATNELGGPRMVLPVVGLFAASLATENTRFQDAAFTSLQSLVYANAVSYTVKFVVGRVRPYEGQGAFRFAPFSGNGSFPSGHTATAFAVLTPWVFYYPHPATYTLLVLATGTGVARLARDRHWTTDVLAGGALGFMTAYTLTRRHRGDESRMTMVPVAGHDARGFLLAVRL